MVTIPGGMGNGKAGQASGDQLNMAAQCSNQLVINLSGGNKQAIPTVDQPWWSQFSAE